MPRNKQNSTLHLLIRERNRKTRHILAYRSPGKEEREENVEDEGGVERASEGIESGEREMTASGEAHAEEGLKEGRTAEEEDLDEMAKKQGLMTDEQFQALLEWVHMIEHETFGMAKGLDLASPAVEGEIPNESSEVTVNASTQSGAEVEKEQHKATPEEPKNVKMKLVLKDDPKAQERNSKHTSKRHSGREMKKKGASEVSKAATISSEENDIPQAEKKGKAEDVGQEEIDSPTKPGENPQIAATELGALEETAHPSPTHTGQREMGSPTKPGEDPVIPSSLPVHGIDVQHQQATPTVREESSISEQEI